MPSLPVEVLLGLYLGLLTGIVPAFVAGALGFVVRYVTGVTLPGLGVVVLALSIASIQGGLMGLVEPDIAQSPRLLVAVLVVLMLALYAHSQGDKLGAELPRRLSFSSIRKRTLSADVVEFVGAVGQVTVRPTGPVGDVEGYPPLPADLRATIADGSWQLPADLPLSELEVRLEDRLRTDHDLADVSVSIDERGRATIAAAPPSSGLSRRVPEGHRAVSIDALVPAGLARGDRVVVSAGSKTVPGTVLSVATDRTPTTDSSDAVADGGAVSEEPTSVRHAGGTAEGGTGRVTVVVPRRSAAALLSADRGHVIVQSRATNPGFEALSLLKQAGYAVRRVTVRSTAEPDGHPAAGDVTVLAVRRSGSETDSRRRGWLFAPGIKRRLAAGDEAFVGGPEGAVDAFVEAVGRW